MKIIFTLLLLIFSLSSFAKWSNPILNKYHQQLELTDDNFLKEDIDKWLKLYKSGQFTDLDFSAVNSNNFEPILNLYRASILTRAYFTKGHPYFKNENNAKIALEVTRFWFKNDPTSYNWWFNMIGVQTYLVPIILEFWEKFNPEERKTIKKILSRSDLSFRNFSGQNLLWISDFYIIRGLIFNNPKDIEIGTNKIGNILTYSYFYDGFQPDGSFFQHGALIYNGGYGASFTEVMSKYFYLFDGTQYEFSQKHYTFFDRYVLDHQSKFIFGKWFNFQPSGRYFTREWFDPTAVRRGIVNMLKTKSPRLNEYRDLLNSIDTNLPRPDTYNHHFYIGDMMVHKTKSFYSSLRMHSKRTLNTDFPSNNEGLISHNIADGNLIFFVNPMDYSKIFPYWNYNKIPGTTAEQTPLVPTKFLPGVESGANMVTKGASAFVGGASDGKVGVSVMNFKKAHVNYNLTAQKSWYFLPDSVVALGNKISCVDCKSSVETIVDQARIHTAINQNGRALEFNEKKVKSLDEQKLVVKQVSTPGSWNKINSQMTSKIPNEEIITVSIPHGNKPIDKSYAYSMSSSSNPSPDESVKYFMNNDIHIIHSIKHNLLMGVFFKPGQVKFAEQIIQSSKPIVFMIKNISSNPQLYFSDPTQSLDKASFSLNSSTYSISFPKDKSAGKTLLHK